MIAFTENLAGESSRSRIEKGARSYNELRGELAAVIGELNEKIEALTLKKLPLIKKLAGRAAEKHKELETAILAAPQLFEKPRTAVFHGIKCGFRKNEGRIEFDDPESVVEKIQQFFDAPEPYLRIVTQPNKEALAALPVTELRRLGCRVVDTTDTVVIKSVDDAEKKISVLLKGALDAGLL